MGEVKQKRRKECIENYKVRIIHDTGSGIKFEDIFHGKEFKEFIRNLLLKY